MRFMLAVADVEGSAILVETHPMKNPCIHGVALLATVAALAKDNEPLPEDPTEKAEESTQASSGDSSSDVQ